MSSVAVTEKSVFVDVVIICYSILVDSGPTRLNLSSSTFSLLFFLTSSIDFFMLNEKFLI